NVPGYAAEERNPIPDQHRHSSNNQTLNESRAQEALDCEPTVNVDVMGATGCQLRHDRSRRSSHLFNHASANRRQVDGATTQDHYALVAIWPCLIGQNLLEG